MKELVEIILEDIDIIEQMSFAGFSYRERMKLERTLNILLLKIVGDIEGTGFSSKRRNEVLKLMHDNNYPGSKINVVNKIYDFRAIIKAISSGNPYEKYDALDQIGSDRIEVFSVLKKRIYRINELLNDIYTT